MLYRSDPIFHNYGYNQFYSTLFETAGKICRRENLGTKLIAQWSDGLEGHQLDRLKLHKQLVITNCVIDHPSGADHVYTVQPSYYGLFYCPYSCDGEWNIEKNFACFSNRFDIFRQSWFYHFVRRKWLDQAWISFNCDIGPGRTPNDSYKDLSAEQVFEKSFRENHSVFAKEHAECSHLIPYKNFADQGDLTPWILSSRFSIVLEVWFHGNHCITFSEKTMRNLQLPRPWLLFASAGSVQQLRQWGFDVLDDLVDHHYDTVKDCVQRQIAILNQANNLTAFDVLAHRDRLLRASAHNQALLSQWRQQWFINMEQDFDTATLKAQKL